MLLLICFGCCKGVQNMKKRITIFLTALFLCLSVCIPVSAESNLPRLWDEAGLLDSAEAEELESKLDEISERHQVDVVVVTVESLNGKNTVAYADDFYDENGYGYGSDRDGILLLISMESCDWYISTCGYGITAITDAGRDYMSGQFRPYLSDGEYAEAFTVFADLCDEFITQAENGTPYDTGNLPKKPFSVGRNLLIALAVGLAAAFIITGIMKGQLKTVRRKSAANHYMKNGSLNLVESRDFFLYSHVDRHEKPKENQSGGSSTHTSSSGTTHGGGGGKF